MQNMQITGNIVKGWWHITFFSQVWLTNTYSTTQHVYLQKYQKLTSIQAILKTYISPACLHCFNIQCWIGSASNIIITSRSPYQWLQPCQHFHQLSISILLQDQGVRNMDIIVLFGTVDPNGWNCTGKLNFKLIQQWQSTVMIFMATGQVLNIIVLIVDLSRKNNDWTIPMISSVSMGIILINVIRHYLHVYVNLDKI